MNKEYSYIAFTTDDPALIRRFNRWIKWNWNVEYPVKEVRGADYTTVVWQVQYHNDPIIGRSEEILRSCAERAMDAHSAHANSTYDELWADWTVWSK